MDDGDAGTSGRSRAVKIGLGRSHFWLAGSILGGEELGEMRVGILILGELDV